MSLPPPPRWAAAAAAQRRRALQKLLSTPDKQTRIEAAASLARLGSPHGLQSLERLALDGDVDVRRRVAVMLGQLQLNESVPTLIAMLDDRSDVERAALESLSAVVGQDIAAQANGQPLLPAEQARRWRRWHQERAGKLDGG